MANEHLLLVLQDAEIGQMLERAILVPAGYRVTLAVDPQTIETLVKTGQVDLLIIGEQLPSGPGLELAARLLSRNPVLPILFFAAHYSAKTVMPALRSGCLDYLAPPLRPDEILQAVARALERRALLQQWAHLEARRDTKSLQKRLDGLEALQRIGRSVTALLDLDNVLTAVVEAAVDLSGAEEGSLLLLDEATGELYMRAAKNFQDEFVRTFRLPTHDSLPGQVLRTGKPVVINETTPQKIKTAYLVRTLVYVPMEVHGRVIGVLGVDSRQSGHPIQEYHLNLLEALADYAAIAIENARLYANTEFERKQLETILTQVEDGVIVVDLDQRLLLVNQTIRRAFGLGEASLAGRFVTDVIPHADLVELLQDEGRHPTRTEITLDDGRVFNAQATPIPSVGLAVTMQDITHLKELDRIKSDFVSTVSHDLRSPLTAILGYTELIDRAGPVTDQQREFIRRIQLSVNNITALINDLLDLGRIEAGFDARKEIVPIGPIVDFAIEDLHLRLTERAHILDVNVPPGLPSVLGNPVRLRQLVGNLLSNAIKFTPRGGRITISALAEGGQLILQVSDNGPGIPPADQPYIFDKFYRGSNISPDTPGTGLGLAIVKSIVEDHQGRIWVDSFSAQGSTFIVVLPTAGENL